MNPSLYATKVSETRRLVAAEIADHTAQTTGVLDRCVDSVLDAIERQPVEATQAELEEAGIKYEVANRVPAHEME